MLAPVLVLGALLASQQPGPQEIPVLKANLGDCSADFLVRDADGKPVYNATVHVRVRYGAFSVKRSDLEIGTNADGKARIEGLPNKAIGIRLKISDQTVKFHVASIIGKLGASNRTEAVRLAVRRGLISM